MKTSYIYANAESSYLRCKMKQRMDMNLACFDFTSSLLVFTLSLFAFDLSLLLFIKAMQAQMNGQVLIYCAFMTCQVMLTCKVHVLVLQLHI